MKLENPTALVIIDQQNGIDNPNLGDRNNPNAQLVMLELLTCWRKLNWPVFHVKHRSSNKESVFWPFQTGFDFKPEFFPQEHETVIEKTTPCAFTKTNLEKVLTEIGTTSAVLVGASTNNSVEATARTGGNIGFTIIVIENACFTFAKADYFGLPRTADEVHAMSLANLDGEYAIIAHSSKLQFSS